MATLIQTGDYQAIFVDAEGDIDIVVYHQDSAGNPVDLTGYLLSWTLTIGAVTIVATVGDGITLVEVQGKISLHIPAVESSTFPQGLGKHKLMITSPVDKTLFKGAFVNDT